MESGRLMAADVWLVARVGLVSGSNGSFGDAWVSLLSLYGTALYTHWAVGAATTLRLRSVGALWSSMDGLGHNSTLSGTGTRPNERYFLEDWGDTRRSSYEVMRRA